MDRVFRIRVYDVEGGSINLLYESMSSEPIITPSLEYILEGGFDVPE